VWPNPGNGILNIKSSLTGHSRLSVSNSQGKSIWQSTYSLLPEIISLNLGKVSPGIYILVIENEKSRQIKRIVIE
ncbi:MAG: T9SS type A sorting domain-containing protein, partial [Bacteroidota bacterium]